MSLYGDLTAAGVEVDHHHSDLYFPANPQTCEILARHPQQKTIARQFTNQGEGTPGTWFDVPFAYDPWWKEAREGRSSPV